MPPGIAVTGLFARELMMANSESTKSRELKTKIGRWLSEDYFSSEPLSAPDMLWAFKASTGDGRYLLVGRPIKSESYILLSSGLTISEGHEAKIGLVSKDKMEDFLFETVTRLLTMGLEYQGLSRSPKEIWVHSRIYLDGLTHDSFSQRGLLVTSAISLVRAGIVRLFGESIPSSSQEEVN
jgi:hypothetical protein